MDKTRKYHLYLCLYELLLDFCSNHLRTLLCLYRGTEGFFNQYYLWKGKNNINNNMLCLFFSSPTEPLTLLEPQNPSIDVSELNKFRRSVEFDAIKLRKGRSVGRLI